ncbi:MAG: hypothetical protein KKD63_03855 [Proteobacteria bacterium]|nr:hypothetical protein [Pseudomonadota bacterium]
MVSRTILVGAIFLTLVIRCLPFRNFQNPEGGFFFYSIDSYDHLRRITLGVGAFPGIASFDYYAAFPQGLGQIWSPGFDYLVSLICYVAGGGRVLIDTICFFFNPLAAAITVVAVFSVVRGLFRSEVAAAVAALVFALHPAYIAYSLPMNFDHHAIEPLVALLLFALPLIDPRGKASWWSVLMISGALLVAIVFWRGSTLYWGVAFVSAITRVYVAKNHALARFYAAAFGAAALLVAIYCLVDPWSGAQRFSFAVVSWFHVLILFFGAGIFLLFSIARTRRVFWGWLGLVGVVAVAACVAGPAGKVVVQFVEGLSFLRGQGDPWLDSNSELRSVFQSRYSWWYSATYLTAFWFLAPVSVWVAARKWQRGGCVDPMLLNFWLWVPPVLVMGFTIRYSHIAGLFSSISAGFLVHYLWQRHRSRCLQYGVAASVLVLLLPGIPHYQEAMTANLPDSIRLGLYGADGLIPWIRNHTPPTSYWLEPGRKPEYGVLARWTLGARLYQDAQRPSLSTAFGWETYGFYQEAGFWVTEDESKAIALLEKGPIRYVVAQAAHDLKTDYALVLQGQQRGDLPSGLVDANFLPERSIQSRLIQSDGSIVKLADNVVLPAISRLRLVYEGNYLARGANGASLDLSYYKLFESVQGAVISGKGAPLSQVILSLELQTGRGRKFTYLTRSYIGADGSFALRVPYSTTERQGDTSPLGRYTLYVGKEKQGVVTVSEADVTAGREVHVEW